MNVPIRRLLQFNLLGSLCFQEECANFIRLIEPWNRTQLYVCGTGAYNPVCTFVNRGRKPQVRTRDLNNVEAEEAASSTCILNGIAQPPLFFLLPKL